MRFGGLIEEGQVNLGDRFRLLVNPVEAIPPSEDLPHLPVARALWRPEPDLETAAAAWVYAGGAHHTGYSLAIGAEPLEDLAEMVGIECVVIDRDTRLRSLRKELAWGDAGWG
ncbi:MAG: hypothetical protein AAF711_00895 [Planctomycetota bacterium]